ncbi:uncharacterized protein J4E79_011144 [Alternaria viburni]|uniref:uncharacterized protein n=1 Tax=Alternaria viburni TaxID=566460 RepID=UPI0020C30085|nr:uncharacterized protein J4E79_011144 [Alternaria viburni]KAI4644196.1 hypothetical protein J4E79_011144 [Alternaria viburni]
MTDQDSNAPQGLPSVEGLAAITLIAEEIARIDDLRTQERLTAHRAFEQHPQPPVPSFPTTQHDRAQQPSEEVQEPSLSRPSRSQRGLQRSPNIVNYSLRDRFKTQQGHKQQSPGEGQQAPASNAPTLDHNLGAEDRCEEPDLPKETAKTIQARYDGLKKSRCSVAHWGIWRQTNPTPHKRFVPNLRTHKVTLDDKSFQLDRLFSHDATPGDIFAELEPWVLHLSSKLAEGKYHCLVLLAFGFSCLGKTRVMTGDAAGGPFTLNTSVIGCTSQLLFEHKPPEVRVVRRLIEIRPSENKQIEVYSLE